MIASLNADRANSQKFNEKLHFFEPKTPKDALGECSKERDF